MNKATRYLLNIALGFDQLGNTVLGGSPDETISSHIGRIKRHYGGTIPWSRPFAKITDAWLNVIDKNHSLDAIEHDEAEQIKRESIFDGDLK